MMRSNNLFSRVFLCLSLFTSQVLSDDLLEQDAVFETEDLLFEEEQFSSGANAPLKIGSVGYDESLISDSFRLSLSRQASYGSGIEQSFMGARIEFDRPLFTGAYARIDYQVNHYFSPDSNAKEVGSAYTHRNLNEAWLQLSYKDCVVKLGKQNLFWGRVEGAYALDQISPIDYTKALLTNFSDIRLASEMAMARCYHGAVSSELFYQADTRFNRLSHFESSIDRLARNGLGDEWGGRLEFVGDAYELSVNYAKLYDNQYSVLTDNISFTAQPYSQEYELYGLSIGIPNGNMMYEVDIGHKTKQVSSPLVINNEPADLKPTTEFALGFEYLSSSNHQINGGVWRYHYLDSIKNKINHAEIWNVTWSKAYLKDLLELSLLATWLSQNEIAGLNIASVYELSDNLEVSFSAAYSSRSNKQISLLPDSKFRLFMKVEAQF